MSALNFFSLAILSLLLLPGCRSDTGGTDRLTGRWVMVKVVDHGEDITAQHFPSRRNWLEFRNTGMYVGYNHSEPRDSGEWHYDSFAKTLHLEGRFHLSDSSHWVVRFNQNAMTWQGIRTKENRRLRLTFLRRRTW